MLARLGDLRLENNPQISQITQIFYFLSAKSAKSVDFHYWWCAVRLIATPGLALARLFERVSVTLRLARSLEPTSARKQMEVAIPLKKLGK